MRLVKIGVEGWKRFQEKSEMNVDSKLVAIVGPNEAGKSSLLLALLTLDQQRELNRGGENVDLTRNSVHSPTSPLVWAQYKIEDADRAALSEIYGVESLTWYQKFLMPNGELEFDIIPELYRDPGWSQRAARALRKASRRAWFPRADDGSGRLSKTEVVELGSQIDSGASGLITDELLARLPAEATELREALVELQEHEKSPDPNQVAYELLESRCPRFLYFSDADRELASTYQLEPGIDFPRALRNLADLAQLDLEALAQAIASGDASGAETRVQRANANLRAVFEQKWTQSGISVHFSWDGPTLRMMAGSANSQTGFVPIAERSDGMRWFTALAAFMSSKTFDVPPVLLIDEAEQHLHYDAQADLVQMLARQSFAAKAIYTTHSAGCLPEDLGAGVRIVSQSAESERSVLRNWFWEDHSVGFTPLLMAMGATALAFTPSRYALLTEGASDFVLLPLLFREISGREVLGFQIAPGIAEVAPADVRNLELEGGRVAYLVDGDDGGVQLKSKLTAQGIPADRIFSLVRGSVIEDYVEKGVYLKAVNEELARSSQHRVAMRGSDLPASARPSAVDAWCRGQRVSAPNRRAVAMQVVEQAQGGNRVAAAARRRALEDLLREIGTRLGL